MTPPIPAQPVEVLFSSRAHAAICAETLEHHPNETGGILLGRFHQHRWQVLEAIDPGPGAQCTLTTFRYDQAYVSHLAGKLARQYRQPLELIGLWHRHPGSFDRFSGDDDLTNRRFAAGTAHGALSCLVNLDPSFRITAYHVPLDLRYQRLPVWIGDGLIDADLRVQLGAADLDPDRLANAELAQELARVFARQPRSAQPLAEALAVGLEPLLERLEQQQHWRYGLRACGRTLQLALLERDGPRRQLWELRARPDGAISARPERGLALSAGQFASRVLEAAHHGA